MQKTCRNCERPVAKDVVALNKKLVGRSTKCFLCIACLAQYLGCTEDDLLRKLEEFKDSGCTLFT